MRAVRIASRAWRAGGKRLVLAARHFVAMLRMGCDHWSGLHPELHAMQVATFGETE